jgi:hypothetical protein
MDRAFLVEFVKKLQIIPQQTVADSVWHGHGLANGMLPGMIQAMFITLSLSTQSAGFNAKRVPRIFAREIITDGENSQRQSPIHIVLRASNCCALHDDHCLDRW